MDTDMNGPSSPGLPKWANSCDFQHHTLRFRYPAFELLPHGKQPIIEMPRGVPDREEPEISPLGLSSDDLDIFVKFPTEHGITVGGMHRRLQGNLHPGPQPLNLAAAVDRLSSFAGISDMHFVSYVDHWDVITRFQLKTTFYTNFGKLDDTVQDFELASADIAKLIRTMSGEKEWVRQLDDLIHAKTDRAYLCRYRELINWDEEWTFDDEERWQVDWDSCKIIGSRERFAKRVVAIYQLSDGTVVKEALPKLEEFEDQAFYAEMPCGHRSMLPENYIHDMLPRDVITAICDECERPILSAKDRRKLGYLFDRLRRLKWEDSTTGWLPKCKKVRNDSSLVEISSGTLSASLLNALETFKLPESINPKSLCPTTYPESRSLLNKLVDTLKAHTSLPAMTPKAMFTNLEKLAWQMVEEMVGDATLMTVVLPPGFDDIVSRWMTRAVNDAVGTEADDDRDDDLMDVVTKMNRAKIDPRDAKTEDDLDGILLQMGETKLEQECEDEDAAEDATQASSLYNQGREREAETKVASGKDDGEEEEL